MYCHDQIIDIQLVIVFYHICPSQTANLICHRALCLLINQCHLFLLLHHVQTMQNLHENELAPKLSCSNGGT